MVLFKIFTNFLKFFSFSETFYLFGDIDREMWKPLLDQYKLPSWNLPGHEVALSFGIAAVGTGFF